MSDLWYCPQCGEIPRENVLREGKTTEFLPPICKVCREEVWDVLPPFATALLDKIAQLEAAQPVCVGYIDDMDEDRLRYLEDNPELTISHINKEQEDDYQYPIYLDPPTTEGQTT